MPEAIGLITDTVRLDGVGSTPCTWVRTLRDLILEPDKQLGFAATLPACEVVDLDAGHMCMVSRPADLAGILAEAVSSG